MKIVIVKEDNRVIVDGASRTVNCSSLPSDFHALHWDGVTGEVEYSAVRCPHCGSASKKANATVTEITAYQPYVVMWGVENARVKAAEAQAAQEKEAAANAAGPQA